MILSPSLLLAAAIAVTQPAATTPAPLPPAKAAAPAPAAIDLSELDSMRGGAAGQSLIITDQTLKAVNAGNSVNGETVTSGAISIGADAFSGYSGIGNFALNTGHNNNLQSTVSVSIIMAPPLGQ